jgi:hypothetical protein
MAQGTGIVEILRQAKTLAQQYRALTGKPLGIIHPANVFRGARVV